MTDEQAVREWLAGNTRNGVLYRLAEQALALLDAKDAEIAELRTRPDPWLTEAVRERDATLSRAEQAERERDEARAQLSSWHDRYFVMTTHAEQAEAALAEERKAHQAFREEVSEAVENAETVGDLFHFILPAKPADPLVAVLNEGLDRLGEFTAEEAANLRAAIERAGGTINFERNG